MERAGLCHKWEMSVPARLSQLVLPDDCVDVLRICRSDRPDVLRLTDFDFGPRNVRLEAGVILYGYRLRPGTRVDPRSFRAMGQRDESVAAFVEREAIRSDDADEAIEALLEPGTTVSGASKRIRVAIRTLQRRLRELALPSPEYWRQLGRARRAVARALVRAYTECDRTECNRSGAGPLSRAR